MGKFLENVRVVKKGTESANRSRKNPAPEKYHNSV